MLLQYGWPEGKLAGIEIWQFSKRFNALPVTIPIGEGLAVRIPQPSLAFA